MGVDVQTEDSAIRALVGRWVEAACAKDLDGVMACYAPEVVAFDAIAALRFEGTEAYRKHWEYCMGFAEGEMIMRIPDMDITVGGDIAFCHYLANCGCTDTAGNERTGWMRGTVCLRRIDGRWLIDHEHYSVPFDPETMKVMTELQP
ncbi:ketosteroid isomerase-like protein [Salinisphaera sp. PC39]|uniref:YybH family protein n=1 Tax=Salinisphaera sp. PC39 TaxID=1304156 RepID=UPI00334115BE